MVFCLLISTCLLSACTGLFNKDTILDIVKDKYQIDDTVKSSVNQDDTAMIFLAKNQSIDDVSKALQKEKKPDRASNRVDNKKVLVYENYFVTLTKDDKDPKDTNIEVATYGFVRDNYRPSFFDGLLAYYILDNLFDVDDWHRKQGRRCYATNGCYQGYNHSGGHYKGPGSKPLFRSSSIRGGGPNAGK
ncbi:uncharacterized protein DUF4247 [Scopulibacillus darangshiensis]|uniref:Uncharacterized protein DUF4247 n=2 Tax=Scopulibacillus darangshiensis TaxID=442528 RepID=A0A4R2PDT2_9BACL|nr:uncharacterized protein DUF4247 [Scopulibacillus darangshiensis]